MHQPAGTADKTTTGLLDRLLESHFRPTGQYRVGVRTRPTDRYQDNRHHRERQPVFVGSDLARAPTRTLVSLTDCVVDTGASSSSLPAKRRPAGSDCRPAVPTRC